MVEVGFLPGVLKHLSDLAIEKTKPKMGDDTRYSETSICEMPKTDIEFEDLFRDVDDDGDCDEEDGLPDSLLSHADHESNLPVAPL